MRTVYSFSLSHFVPLALLAVLLMAGAAVASDEVNSDKTGLALSGYDPVAYFKLNKPAKGDFQVTAEHQGAVYRFANEAHRDLFRKNPSRYLPQYGNYCAYGVSVGAKFSADPTVWKIVKGRLYLNLDENIAKLFNQDLAGHIKKADENWRTLAKKPAR